jgi:hypothetical protein
MSLLFPKVLHRRYVNELAECYTPLGNWSVRQRTKRLISASRGALAPANYAYGPSYQTYHTSPGYGFRGSSVGSADIVSTSSREVIRSNNFASGRGVVRTRVRGQAFVGSNVRERGHGADRLDWPVGGHQGRAMGARASANVRSNEPVRSETTVGRSGHTRGSVNIETRSGTAGRRELGSGGSVRGRGSSI